MRRKPWRAAALLAAAVALGATAAATDAQTAGATSAAAADVRTAAGVAALRQAVQLDPRTGEQKAIAAEARAGQLPAGDQRETAILTARYFRIEALLQLNRGPDAAPLIEDALAKLPRAAAVSKLHGDLLMSRAAVRSADGQAQAALDDYQAAYRLFVQTGLPRNQAVALMGIGSIYQDAGDYGRVLYYYRLADEAYPNDPYLTLSSANNQANALAEMQRYAAAEAKYRAALRVTRALRSPVLEARILNNVADMQIDQGNLAGAEATIRDGLKLAATATGGDEWRRVLLGTAARVALTRRQPELAVKQVEAALDGLDAAAAADQSYRGLHETAYRAYRAAGRPRQALEHFEIYTKLDAEGRALVSKTSAALMAAKFDFANQNLRISALTAGQLKRDVALARLQARQNALWLGGLLAVAVVTAAALALYLLILRRSRNAVNDANKALSAANAELETALSAKSRFLATTSHEIRTPLNGVLGMTQLLLHDPGVDAGTRDRVAMIHHAGETMRGLVDDILDFAKMEGGTIETQTAALDLSALLDDLVRFWTPQAAAKNIVLTLTQETPPRMILGDAGRLRQILSNLLANAIKFTDAGGVTVSATVGSAGTKQWLVIDVTDTGIGIADAHYDSIFEMFTQLDNSTSRRFGGTGLGLAISRTLARALDGDITVASVPGQGSTFTLKLPYLAAAESAASEGSAQGDTARHLAEALVLLAGGAPIAQSVLVNILRPSVASVTTASTLSAPTATSVDIMLVDGGTISPQQFASWFSTVAETTVRPWIVVIAPVQSDRSAEAYAGADRVLDRPLKAQSVIDAVAARFSGLDATMDKDQFTPIEPATA